MVLLPATGSCFIDLKLAVLAVKDSINALRLFPLALTFLVVFLMSDRRKVSLICEFLMIDSLILDFVRVSFKFDNLSVALTFYDLSPSLPIKRLSAFLKLNDFSVPLPTLTASGP